MGGCGRLGFGDEEGSSEVGLGVSLIPAVYSAEAKLCVKSAAEVQYALTTEEWPRGWQGAQFAELAAGAGVLAKGTKQAVADACTKITLDAAAAPDKATLHLYAMIPDGAGGTITSSTTEKLNPAWKLYEFPCSSGKQARYWLHLPEAYYREGYNLDPKPLPTVLFLHGAGSDGNEAGINVDKLRDFEELTKLYQQRSPVVRDLPFLVYAPQCNADLGGCFGWSNPNHLPALDEVLLEVRKIAKVDDTRFYVTGESTGGEGAWRYAIHRSELVAAVVSVANTLLADTPEPGFYRDNICTMSHIPVWAFHNEADTIQPASNTLYLTDKIQTCVPAPKFTPVVKLGNWMFNGSSHAGWVEVYGDTHGGSNSGYTSIYKWMLEHSRPASSAGSQSLLTP